MFRERGIRFQALEHSARATEPQSHVMNSSPPTRGLGCSLLSLLFRGASGCLGPFSGNSGASGGHPPATQPASELPELNVSGPESVCHRFNSRIGEHGIIATSGICLCLQFQKRWYLTKRKLGGRSTELAACVTTVPQPLPSSPWSA